MTTTTTTTPAATVTDDDLAAALALWREAAPPALRDLLGPAPRCECGEPLCFFDDGEPVCPCCTTFCLGPAAGAEPDAGELAPARDAA